MVFDTKHKSFGENVTGLLRLIQLRGGCGGGWARYRPENRHKKGYYKKSCVKKVLSFKTHSTH